VKKSLLEKTILLFEDWTPCLAVLLWQGALRSSQSNIVFVWRIAVRGGPGRKGKKGGDGEDEVSVMVSFIVIRFVKQESPAFGAGLY
jgi:hypothetical protein